MTKRPSRNELRKFGFSFLLALGLLALFFVWRKHENWAVVFASLSLLFGLLGLLIPGALIIVYKPWMQLAEWLGWFNTRLLLFAVFALTVTPIGLVMRVFGKDQLERHTRKSSYWSTPAKHSMRNRHFERQF